MDTVSKFLEKLPAVKSWIKDLLHDHRNGAVTIANLNFPRIQKAFSSDLLEKAGAIYVAGKIPVPPLSRMGLTEFAGIEQMAISGITYDDSMFINENYKSEGLHFHELVHVVQWQRLGFDNFLTAYGIGMLEFGYENSPFEKMAYELQRLFATDDLPRDLLEDINRKTDDIWISLLRKTGEWGKSF